MVRVYLSWLLVICMLCVSVVLVSAGDYGTINVEHDTPLPNIVNNRHMHYILANLPVSKDGEKLASWQFLFTPKSEQAIATQRGNVNLHVLRPTGYHQETSNIRQVAYVQTIPLTDVQSFQVVDLTAHNIFLQEGDLLAISVPDDSVMVRVGANNQGLSIPHGVMSLPMSEDLEEGYEGYYQLSQMTGDQLLQLCTKFTTYSSGDTSGTGSTAYPHDAAYFSSNYMMTTGGVITKVKVRTVRSHTTNSPSTLKLYIAVGTPNSDNKIVIYSRTQVTIFLDSQELILPTPIPVNAGDYVGHYTLASENAGSSGSTIRLGYQTTGGNRGYWSAGYSASQIPQAGNTRDKPRFTFTVETDIPDRNGGASRCSGSFCGVISGGPQDECDKYGLTSLGKDDFNQQIASKSAQIVLVKGGECYTVYENVCQGTALATYDGKVISHVTYCGSYQCTTTPPPTTSAPTTLAPTTSAPTSGTGNSGLRGDPQFSGFQGQSFQFHGLADEHFNLISSPQLQMNSHFVYLSSGHCRYNNTVCFQHPGTYVDSLGLMIPSETGHVYIKLVSGSHDDGLRVWMDSDSPDEPTEIKLNEFPSGISWRMNNETTQQATVQYTQFGEITIRTPLFHIRVVNAEYFFNLELALLDHHVLRMGRARHVITDSTVCHHDTHAHATINNIDMEDEKSIHAQHDHGMVEKILNDKYQVDFPLHGLIGQTWRNAFVCGKWWIGHVQDYVTSDLFSTDYFYNMRD